jgi:formate dehydrogenase subunit gamma
MSASPVMPDSRLADRRENRIVRYTLDERIHHWLGSITYIYCLITGLAFWSPYLFWLLKLWSKDMATTDADRAWSKAMKYYIENEDEKVPPEGRFNYGQKLFFWLMLYGALLLLLSGLGLWFVESIPPWLRHLSIAVHVIAALTTIAGFIIHVYMSTAMVRGSFSAMVEGDVTASWARHHHRLWYERVTGRK